MGLSSAQILIALVQIFASVATSHGENVEVGDLSYHSVGIS